MNKEYFQGTGRLIRLLFHQNRFKIIAWVSGIVLVSLAVALAYPEIYTTQEDIMGFAFTMENPAMAALVGSNYNMADFNIGVIYASEMLLFTSLAVAVMNILLMKSSSRGDEEEGRLEIVQSLPVGKTSYLTASFIMVFLVNLSIIVLLTLGLGLFGEEVFSWESSLLYSSILGTTGLFFAGITGVSAQLASSVYGTNILSMSILLLSYIIRVIGDVQNETLSLLSPLGWATRTEVFVEDHWLPFVVLIAGAVVFIILAFILHARRDMFAGILPDRPGKQHASAFLKSIPGIVWHLEKTKTIAWFFLIFFLSTAFGSILGELETYFSDMELIKQFLIGSASDEMVEQFVSFMFAIMSVFSLFPVISVLFGVKSEEIKGHIEHFYARSISRNKIMGTYFILAFFTGVLMQLATALGVYLSSSEVLENMFSLRTLIEMSLVYLPAIFLVIGLAALFVGFLPKFTPIVWGYVVFVVVILYLGSILDFPEWMNTLSVFHHVPEYPHEEINWIIMGLLTTIGAILTLLGFVMYNHRDIKS